MSRARRPLVIVLARVARASARDARWLSEALTSCRNAPIAQEEVHACRALLGRDRRGIRTTVRSADPRLGPGPVSSVSPKKVTPLDSSSPAPITAERLRLADSRQRRFTLTLSRYNLMANKYLHRGWSRFARRVIHSRPRTRFGTVSAAGPAARVGRRGRAGAAPHAAPRGPRTPISEPAASSLTMLAAARSGRRASPGSRA